MKKISQLFSSILLNDVYFFLVTCNSKFQFVKLNSALEPMKREIDKK